MIAGVWSWRAKSWKTEDGGGSIAQQSYNKVLDERSNISATQLAASIQNYSSRMRLLRVLELSKR